MSDLELCYTGARKLARMIRTRKVSATEAMRAFISRIEAVNPKVDAIVTFLPEQALKRAKALDRKGSATSHPAISVPAGFTEDGLPVGLQIVGRYRDDFGVLQLAHAFEGATGTWKRRPMLA